MAHSEFLPLLENELYLRSQPFERAELAEWLACVWPHVEDDPDVYFWAGQFLDAQRAEVPG
jgi:hypothetical protein